MACGPIEDRVLPACYDNSVYNDTTPIAADPDIAGIGVISAFVISAGLAIIISFLHILLQADTTFDKYIKNKTKWLKVCETLILTLSDQQLVTGLAILIAAFVRWNEITVYHWEIVTDLAFVASNTHLCTLAILRHPFRQHEWRWARLWRVTTMVIFAILLFVANIYTGYRYWDDFTAWPMRCVAQDLKRGSQRYFRGSQASLAIVWALFLVSNYFTAILGLFESICDWTRNLVEQKREKARYSYQRLKADPEEGELQYSPRIYIPAFPRLPLTTKKSNSKIRPAP